MSEILNGCILNWCSACQVIIFQILIETPDKDEKWKLLELGSDWHLLFEDPKVKNYDSILIINDLLLGKIHIFKGWFV